MADLSTQLLTTALHDRMRLYKSPTLETVLASYGYSKAHEDDDDATYNMKKEKGITHLPNQIALASIRKTPPKSSNVKKKEKHSIFGEEYLFQEDNPKEELERLRLKDAYLLRLLSEDEQERYFGHITHKEKVEAKVAQQREAALLRKRCEKELENRRKEKEFANSHHIKKRLECVMLNYNDEFIDTVPKSEYYKILQIEKEMERQGLLRTAIERDNFWSDHLRKAGLMHKKSLEQVNLGKAYNDAVKSSTKNNDSNLDRIVEEVDEEKSSPPIQPKAVPEDRYSIHSISKIFPKMEFPKLHCYELNLSNEKMSQEEARQLEYLKRQEERFSKKRLHTKLYHLALSHGTLAQRILNEQFDAEALSVMQGENNNLANLFSDLLRKSVPDRLTSKTRKAPHNVLPLHIQMNKEDMGRLSNILQQETSQSSLPFLSHPQTTYSFEPIDEEDSDRESKVPSGRLLKSDGSHRSASASRKPMPLSLVELQKQCTVLNAVKPSSFWTNYADIGAVED